MSIASLEKRKAFADKKLPQFEFSKVNLYLTRNDSYIHGTPSDHKNQREKKSLIELPTAFPKYSDDWKK